MYRWPTIFFAVNFGLAVALLFLCVYMLAEALVSEQSPFAIMGGVMLGLAAIVGGVLEWCLYVRRAKHLECLLGVLYCVVGFFACYGLARSAVEAIAGGDSLRGGFWVGFAAVVGSIAGWSFWCGWYRVRGRTFPEERGFPVEPRTPGAVGGAKAGGEIELNAADPGVGRA